MRRIIFEWQRCLRIRNDRLHNHYWNGKCHRSDEEAPNSERPEIPEETLERCLRKPAGEMLGAGRQ